ncbi:C-X-C motif chemokine 13 [Trichechus manatus latirostris]|uniref:C-X-C motif chemokine n=1 Tax=Trichechus manatus latirostris TaxID=127582 RepID=A0A2Y9FYX1_TRIMA|nr:C-X-C motif chemokine 13 [Trichechus manatus latirostris]
MRFTSASLLLLLLAISLSPVQGFLEANYTNLKCNCIQQTSAFIPMQRIQRLQISPAGSGCPNVEVIVWMKNNTVVCLNPYTKWFRKFLKMLQK